MALLLGEEAGDGGEAPILVRLVELGRSDAVGVQARAELRQLVLVTAREVDVRGVVVGGATVEVGVLKAGMGGLNGLLREGEIAAGNDVQIRLGRSDLQLRHGGALMGLWNFGDSSTSNGALGQHAQDQSSSFRWSRRVRTRPE